MPTVLDDPELKAQTDFACLLLQAPTALLTLREAVRGRFHLPVSTAVEVPAVAAPFCNQILRSNAVLTVGDTHSDPRFALTPQMRADLPIRFYAGVPLHDNDGEVVGTLCVTDTLPRSGGLTAVQVAGLEVLAKAAMRRLSDHSAAEAIRLADRLRDEQLRRIMDGVPGVAFSADHLGNFDYFNARWEEITGRPGPRTAADWQPFFHPDDWNGSIGKWERAVADNTPFEDRWRLRTRNGTWCWVLSRAVPTMMETGHIRWFGALIDVDEAQNEATARELLARELSHRIKNVFAVVLGLISLHGRQRPDLADYTKELTGAISALSVANNYVTPDADHSQENLRHLLDELLKPYAPAGATAIAVSAPELRVTPTAATPLALVFHELATNSVKYGALAARGTVAIRIAEEGDTVLVEWTEEGETISPPSGASNEGFGSRLLRLAVEGQLRGQFERRFTDSGIAVTLRLPRDRVVKESV